MSAAMSSTEGMELYLVQKVVQSLFVWTPPSCSLPRFSITRVKCMLTFFSSMVFGLNESNCPIVLNLTSSWKTQN